MARVKITVVKRLNFHEIHRDSNLGCSTDSAPVCDKYFEGQEFIMDWEKIPEGLCPHAFVDISRYISGLRAGANYPWMKEQGKGSSCLVGAF